jgi:hypothetical protein
MTLGSNQWPQRLEDGLNHRHQDPVQAMTLGSNPSGSDRKSRCCMLLSFEASGFRWSKKEPIDYLYTMAFASKYQ